jgi:hypothetical protein
MLVLIVEASSQSNRMSSIEEQFSGTPISKGSMKSWRGVWALDRKSPRYAKCLPTLALQANEPRTSQIIQLNSIFS